MKGLNSNGIFAVARITRSNAASSPRLHPN